MLQYLLTGIAGIVLGIVAMRVWQARDGQDGTAPGTIDQALPGDAPAAAVRSARPLLIGAGALAAAAVAVLVLRPGSETTTNPAGIAPGGPAAAAEKPLDDVDTMMQRLADRLEKNPTDGEGFRMLAWSYVMTGHPDKAIAPYKRAIALLPNQANAHAGYGEALVGVAKGTVTQEAKDAFDKAIGIDRSEPRARYFEALWLAQHGREKDALDKWIVLANDGPADAPWQAELRRQIGETANKLGIDASSRLNKAAAASAAAPPQVPASTMQAAAALPPAERQAMVDQMVEGLAKKLAANPTDADGWIRLLRSRMVLKQEDQARRDLASARRGLTAAPADLARVEAAAKENGVPGS